VAAFQTDSIPSLSQAADEVRAEVDRRLDGILGDLGDLRQRLAALLAQDRAASMLAMIQARLSDVPADVVTKIVQEGQTDLARKIVEQVFAGGK